MKRTIFLIIAVISVIFLLTGTTFAQDFTFFKPLSIPDYSICMPGDAVLPDKNTLRLVEKRVNPMDSRVTMFLYQNTEKVYIDENGELTYPYMEMTIEADDYAIHLLAVSFINEKLEIEMYENRAAFGDSHQDELMRTSHFKQKKIREFSR